MNKKLKSAAMLLAWLPCLSKIDCGGPSQVDKQHCQASNVRKTFFSIPTLYKHICYTEVKLSESSLGMSAGASETNRSLFRPLLLLQTFWTITTLLSIFL